MIVGFLLVYMICTLISWLKRSCSVGKKEIVGGRKEVVVG